MQYFVTQDDSSSEAVATCANCTIQSEDAAQPQSPDNLRIVKVVRLLRLSKLLRLARIKRIMLKYQQ